MNIIDVNGPGDTKRCFKAIGQQSKMWVILDYNRKLLLDNKLIKVYHIYITIPFIERNEC